MLITYPMSPTESINEAHSCFRGESVNLDEAERDEVGDTRPVLIAECTLDRALVGCNTCAIAF